MQSENTTQTKNLKAHFWATKRGGAQFETQRAFGVLNAEGTHALWSNKSQQPMTWGTMQTAKEVAPHAEAMASGDRCSWVRVFTNKSEVPKN